MQQFFPILILVSLLWTLQSASGDTFTVREDHGSTVVIDARLIGERQGLVALERSDGRIEVVPQQQILARMVGPGPEPLSSATIVERLTKQFGADKFRSHTEMPYVVGLILSEPLEPRYELVAKKCLKGFANFMKKVERVFLDFINELNIDSEKPRFPLVVLIFETDDLFNKFHAEETGGHGLSSESTMGYYSALTNRLVIRMSECNTKSTPLHEAIHQQVYNRGILQRLAPIPVWFNEGIATGFEGNGDKIKNGPLKINSRYARRAMEAKTVNWDDIVAGDKAFVGDVLAGEAYAHAWSIHWFLLTKYRKKYIEYLKLLGQKVPLQTDDTETRTKDFERVFGKRIGQLQNDFPAALEQAAIRQVIPPEDVRDGYLITQTNLAEVEMTATKNGATGELEAEGKMRNLSQIRPMTFHITMETDGGKYAEWYLPNTLPLRQIHLPKQVANKQMKGAPNRESQTFRIKVKSVLPESETDNEWQRGQLPVPVWSDQ